MSEEKERKREAGYEIRCIQRMIHHAVERIRIESEDSLTFVQTRTLSFLLMHPNQELYQKDVEQELKIRRSTATEILKVLERDGYIIRESVASDKRLKRLIPTQKAKELGLKMHENIQKMEHRLVQGIDAKDLEVFFKVTTQMRKNLKGDD